MAMKMKFSEDFEYDRDREIDFQTDDEDNKAERSFAVGEESSDSESPVTPSRNIDAPMDFDPRLWPQSYRESMNIYAVAASPSLEFLKETSLHRLSSFSFYGRQSYKETSDHNSPLTTKLLSGKGDAFANAGRSSNLSSHNSIDLDSNQQCSFGQAVLNGLNILFGIGLLATPYATKQGGWLSLFLLAFFCCICCYTGILLKRCLESSPRLRSYPDIGQAAFGAAGRIGIAIILYTELYAISVEFIVMMGDNLGSIFPDTYWNISGMTLAPNQIFAIIATLFVLPTVWLRDLSLLSYVSAGGVIISLLVMLCLFWVGIVGGVGFHPSGVALNLQKLPIAVGVYSFCFSGHSTFPSQYSSMKNPAQFPTVLIICFFISGALYIVVAVSAFLMFGDTTKSQFTLSMPPEYLATRIAIWTTVVSPVTKYALILTPVAMGLEELLPTSHLRYLLAPLFLRTALVISTLVVALTFQYFALIMALIGNLFATLITFIFPCACFLSIYRSKITKFEVAFCTFIIAMAMFCGCIGTYFVVLRVASEFS